MTYMKGYYLITLNSSQMVDGYEVQKVALSQTTRGGMWTRCLHLPGLSEVTRIVTSIWLEI